MGPLSVSIGLRARTVRERGVNEHLGFNYMLWDDSVGEEDNYLLLNNSNDLLVLNNTFIEE